MTETTKKEASTLHRLLEIGKFDEDALYKESSDYEGAPNELFIKMCVSRY